MDQTATLIYVNQMLLRERKKRQRYLFKTFPCFKVARNKNCDQLRETWLIPDHMIQVKCCRGGNGCKVEL